MSDSKTRTSESLISLYSCQYNDNHDTTETATRQDDAGGDNDQSKITDITEIELMGKPSKVYRTPPGAKYENDKKLEGPYAKHTLIIRRVHSLGDDKPQVHLQIQSQALMEFFKGLPHSAITLPIHEFPLKIPQPYKGIFHFRDEIQQAASNARFSHLRNEFFELKKFQKEYMETMIQEVDALVRSGRISYDYLWALYKPGDLVALWRLDDNGRPNPWLCRAQNLSYITDQRLWKIEILATAIRGDCVGGERDAFEFPAFLGTIKINELPVIPLRYLPNAEKIKAEALKRAELYLDIVRPPAEKAKIGKRTTPAHLNYEGPVWIPKDSSQRNPDPYMWMYEMKKGRVGCRFFDPASFHTKSDVIIDPELFVKENHKFMIDLVDSSLWVPQAPADANLAPRASSSHSATTPTKLTRDQLLTLPPWVPAFCLSVNKWGFVLVGDWLQEAHCDRNAISRLELLHTTKTQLFRLVQGLLELGSITSASSRQINNEKGRGLNIILHGSPGVGKTMTAECVAQALQRPLYRLNGGDLGSNVSELETALEKAFKRSKKWRAVMLIDEADAFMMKRDDADIIEQKAMVSAILRKLEYQNGVIFLTTNRINAVDEAILSRMHVNIKYPSLTESARINIWRSHLEKVGRHALSESQIGTLGELALDGRAINNIAYLASLMAGGETILWDHVQESMPLIYCDNNS